MMKDLIRYNLILIALLFISHNALCHNTPDLADSLYKIGKYQEAINEYNTIASTQGASSQLLYNIGNSYARIGDYGNASLYYLRSLRLDPSNVDAQNNLKFIESKVLESNQSELRGKKFSLDADSPSFFSSIKLYIARNHLSNTWSIWAIAFFLISIVCIALYLFTSNVIIRKIGFFGGGTSLGLTVIMLIFAFMAAGYHSNEGVVIESKVKLKTEPSSNAQEGSVYLTRGTIMTVIDSIPVNEEPAEWYKVRLNSDYTGWIQSKDFTVVGF